MKVLTATTVYTNRCLRGNRARNCVGFERGGLGARVLCSVSNPYGSQRTRPDRGLA